MITSKGFNHFFADSREFLNRVLRLPNRFDSRVNYPLALGIHIGSLKLDSAGCPVSTKNQMKYKRSPS